MKSNEDNNINIKEKSDWEILKKFLFSHKRYLLPLFPIILISIFLGSMCSSFQKNGHTLPFILCLLGVIILLCLSIFLVTITKKKFIEARISLNIYLSIIFTYMFASGLLLLVGYKILSVVDNNNILNITGLTSVIITLIYILIVIGSFYAHPKIIKKIFFHKKH